MGASKRIAEQYIQALNEDKTTKFIITRFGNVFGSSGSVVPIFSRQIKSGGPVTITHFEMERYFMTLTQACELVLESGAMGKGGEIFMFDMGKPIRILDLAHQMIVAAGLIPELDIKIECVGLRPGEKLQEDLITANDILVATNHPQIKWVKPSITSNTTSKRQKIEAFLDVIDTMKKPIQFFIPQYLLDILKIKKNYQHLHIISYPFLSHDDFDDLLWSCNLNFVRGEDSWIRALWAGKPFIWQPYIQENNLHLIKLKAFLKSYCEDCEQELSEVLFKMHDDWSNNKFNEALWLDFFKNQSSLESFALKRSHHYFKEPSFVESLVDYCSET